MVFDTQVTSNYKILHDLIVHARQESIDMVRRISRSVQFKKNQLAKLRWGKKFDIYMNVIDDPYEQKITKLIKLLNTPGSHVCTI